MAEEQRYRVYLLRLWRVDGDDGTPVWRASLEDAHSGERRGFAGLAELCSYLDEHLAPRAHDDSGPSPTE